jgi:peptidyl-prolyl cis-trans isomerase B (cyclophilin B)
MRVAWRDLRWRSQTLALHWQPSGAQTAQRQKSRPGPGKNQEEHTTVSPNRREREYARRRYEKWQVKQQARQARQHRTRRVGAIAGSALLVVLVIVGAVYLFNRPGSGGKASAASTTTTPTASPSASVTTQPASAGPNPCPAPPPKPATPKKWTKAPAASTSGGKSWTLTLVTSCGKIAVTLDGAKAPQATASMLLMARNAFFNGSPCHRLTTEGIYVLQCGDPTGTGTGGPGFEYGPVENAPKNNVYPAGTVAMARRGGDGKSMGSQFFLVYKDSTIPSDSAGGYTVLGRITSGQDVVGKIAAGGVSGGGGDGEPARAISIVSTSVAPG